MRRPFLAAAVAALLVAACEVSTGPTPTPRQDAADVSLQADDLPPGLSRCHGSGPIEAYLRGLKPGNPSAWDVLARTWQQARQNGADAAQVTLFSGDPGACSGGLIAPAGGSAASLTLRYSTSQSAVRAWKGGILDLTPPAPDQQSAGLVQGLATGLGRNAWTFERSTSGRPSFLAFWQNGSFDILVGTGGLPADQSRTAAVAVSGRVR